MEQDHDQATLDLSAVRADLTEVRDLRQAGESTEEPDARADGANRRSGGHAAVGCLLGLGSLFVTLAGLAIVLVTWPFDALLGLLLGRRGLVTGLVMLPLQLVTAPIGQVSKRRFLLQFECPLCRRTGGVDHVLDVTADGNTRMSIFGAEPSITSDAFAAQPGERYRVFRCNACLESFIQGPEDD